MRFWKGFILAITAGLIIWQLLMFIFLPASIGLWRIWPLIMLGIFWVIMGIIASKYKE